MLRPLHVFQVDVNGEYLVDRNGDRIPLAEPVPKTLEEFTPDERASWERELEEGQRVAHSCRSQTFGGGHRADRRAPGGC